MTQSGELEAALAHAVGVADCPAVAQLLPELERRLDEVVAAKALEDERTLVAQRRCLIKPLIGMI